MDSTVFTLGDLLSETSLGLELVVGSEACVDRAVVGAHSIEVRDPATWLDRGWVMLTTGMELSSDKRALRELVADLDRTGVAAIGFGVGVAHAEVPQGLRDAADKLDFPIFTVPVATPFREIITTVQQNHASGEARTFNRLTTLQRYMLAALNESCPAACMVERLSSFINADVALVTKDGKAVLGTCVAEPSELAEVLVKMPDHPIRIESSERPAWLVEVSGPEHGTPTWLLVAARNPAIEHALLKPAAQMVAPLLAATTTLDELRQAEDSALRRATMDALLDASSEDQVAGATARASAWGLDPAEGIRIYVAHLRRSVTAEPQELLALVETSLARLDTPWLATARNGGVVVAGRSDLAEDVIGDAMVAAHPQMLVAVGRETSALGLVSQSYTDAELGVRQLAKSGRKRLLSYDDLDLVSAIVGEVSRDRLDARVERWMRPVLENEIAYATLVAYLESDLDVGRTSKALNLHPNSTRYRLARLEQLLGSRLRRPSTIAALHFALLLRNDSADLTGGPVPTSETLVAAAA